MHPRQLGPPRRRLCSQLGNGPPTILTACSGGTASPASFRSTRTAFDRQCGSARPVAGAARPSVTLGRPAAEQPVLDLHDCARRLQEALARSRGHCSGLVSRRNGDRISRHVRSSVRHAPWSGSDAPCEWVALRDLPAGRPTWSPDGRMLAIATDKAVSVVNRDGTGRRVVFAQSTTAHYGDEPGRPSWRSAEG